MKSTDPRLTGQPDTSLGMQSFDEVHTGKQIPNRTLTGRTPRPPEIQNLRPYQKKSLEEARKLLEHFRAARPDLIAGFEEHAQTDRAMRILRLLRPYQVRALEEVLRPTDPSMFFPAGMGHLRAILMEARALYIIPRKKEP